MSTPTSVYRYLDADGVLIYVGVTNRGVQRQGEHNTHAKWWRFVRGQEVEHYDDRETALRRERYLIGKHQPPFNVVHNAEHPRRLAAYLKHADVAIEPCGHCYGCQTAASDDPDDARSEDAACRLLRPLEEDEEASVCSVCNRPECAYLDGVDSGMEEGYRVGRHTAEQRTWREAHDQYGPVYLADLSLRAVIDGHFPCGYLSKGIPEAEQSLRSLQADINEHGIAALVEKARNPWATQKVPL